MCGRFSQLTIDDVRNVLDDIQENISAASDAWSIELSSVGRVDTRIGRVATALVLGLTEEVFGETNAPNTARGHYHLHTKTFTWGFPASWATGKLLFNTRIESATGESGMWPPIAAQGRCLVPALSFWENRTASPDTSTHGARRQVEFVANAPAMGPAVTGPTTAVPADQAPAPITPQLLMIAGVMFDGRLSLVTTAPDAIVAPVHDRMPLCLTPAGARQWLSPDWRRITQRPTAPLRVAPASDPTADAPIQMSLF